MNDAVAPKLFSVSAVSEVMFVQALPATNNRKTVCTLTRLESLSFKTLYNAIMDILKSHTECQQVIKLLFRLRFSGMHKYHFKIHFRNKC